VHSHAVPALHAEPHDRGSPGGVLASPPRRKSGLLWAGVAALAAAVGFGGFALLPSLQTRGPEPPPTVAVRAPAAPSPATSPLMEPPKATEAAAPPPAPASQQPAAAASPAMAAAPTPTPTPTEPKSTVATVLADAAKPAPAAAKAAMPAAKGPAADTPARTAATGPRQECGARTEFSLYRCMQLQCSLPKWQRHPQCERLRATDTVE
jgi:cytoskeletal protein RodZ